MNKFVIVINGQGGVGKDTLCAMAARAYRVKNVSSVTPIKEIAARCGWNGEKTDRARKFLSDLKALTVAYNDFPTNWVVEEYARFLESEDEVMFVHIREPEEIAKFVSRVPRAITLLIRGGTRFRRSKKEYGNASDDGVERYRYDYVFYNDAPLEKTETVFNAFLANVIRERTSSEGEA
jgi:cytidylate kinase